MNINKIINEEIDKTVLFSQLEKSKDELQKLYPKIVELQKIDTNIKPIHNFFLHLQQFTLALIQALERCCKHKTLNEAFGISTYGRNYGLEDVPALSNFVNALKRGWREGGELFSRNRYQGSWGQHYNQGYNQQVPEIKLKELLSQHYIELCNEYDRINKKYDGYLSNLNPPIPQYVSQQVQTIKVEIEKAQ